MIKMVDTAVPMNEEGYPVARAKHIWLDDDTNLQKAIDDGLIGGGGDSSVTLTQQEYEALSEEQKLGGLYYTYDTKRIYKNGVQYGASDAEGIGYNNAESGIQATTVQGAIDKVVKKVDGLISDTTSSTTSTWSSQKTSSKIAEVESVLNELENITRLTDFDEAIPEIGKNKIYYVNKIIGTYKCAQWRVESMYYDVSGAKQYRGVQKATSINGVDNIMLMREYYLDDNVMHWGAWQELATMDKVESKYSEENVRTSTDWNTLNTRARYYFSGGTPMTNSPEAVPFGLLEVINVGPYCRIQRYFAFNGKLYIRRWSGNSWNEWYRFDGISI